MSHSRLVRDTIVFIPLRYSAIRYLRWPRRFTRCGYGGYGRVPTAGRGGYGRVPTAGKGGYRQLYHVMPASYRSRENSMAAVLFSRQQLFLQQWKFHGCGKTCEGRPECGANASAFVKNEGVACTFWVTWGLI